MGVHKGSAVELAILSDLHMLGELRGGQVQVRAKRQGSKAVGQVQAQREDELREVQQSHAVLLQNWCLVASTRQTARLQVRAKGHWVAHRQSKFQKLYILDDAEPVNCLIRSYLLLCYYNIITSL